MITAYQQSQAYLGDTPPARMVAVAMTLREHANPRCIEPTDLTQRP
jgi:hypothetical protein